MKDESNWVGEFEIFLEQVESLQSLLVEQNLDAQELTQELSEANQEIQMLHRELVALPDEPLSFVKALVVAKRLLMTEEPSPELLAQMLSALYQVEVTGKQLEED